MSQLDRLQSAMRTAGLDVLLLGSEGPGHFAAGHSRIGVHMPGWPIPVTVVPATGQPHVVTGDPDGATHLPADHVHGIMWNPATLVTELPKWLGGSGRDLRVGVDALGPGGRMLASAALPGSELVDATLLLAEVMMAKSDDEIARLGELSRFVNAAAEAGLRGGQAALTEALAGAFPMEFPRVTDRSVALAVRRDGLVGEARLGPGDPAVGAAAVAELAVGRSAGATAAALPPGASVVGLGWEYEPPLLRDGLGSPSALELQAGAVLAVRWQSCAVTVHLAPDGPRYLSPSPEEVAR